MGVQAEGPDPGPAELIMRIRTTLFIALVWLGVSLGSAASARAQERGIGVPPPTDEQARLITIAQKRVKDGEESFARGDFEHARTAFDDAIDAFLDSGYDLRSDPELQAAYREAVEKVNRYQSLALNADGDETWPLQAYEATADDLREIDPVSADELAAAGSDLLNASFGVRVAEVERRFAEKFGRNFTLTGRDTSVHARLYGYGRAADVRVSDLSQAHIDFIVQNCRALNMRVLDFSTPDRVYQHNIRVIALGRPLDTLATGTHIHLNDQPRVAVYREQPAAKKTVSGRQ